MKRQHMTVRYLRRLKGWTQVDLAAASGIAQSVISKLEHGRSDPRVSTAARLEDALGVPRGTLIFADDHHETAAS